MAETLYLKDGSVEVIIGEPKLVLRALIEERLGRVLDWIGVPWRDLPDGNFEEQCCLW